MSIRTIRYDLTEDGNILDGRVLSGVQYEENATAVEYGVSDDLANQILSDYSADSLAFRIDFDTDDFGYDPSVNLTRQNGKVVRAIPKSAAKSRECRVNLVIAVEKDGEIIALINSPQSRICFSPMIRTESGSTEETPDISSFLVGLETVRQEIVSNLSEARSAVQTFAGDKQEIEEMLSDADDKIQEINTAANTLTSQNQSAVTNISMLNGLTSTATTKISSLTARNDEAQSNISSLTAQNAAAQSNITSLSTENTAAQSNISSLTAQNEAAQSNITSLSSANSSAQSNITSLTAENTAAQTTLSSIAAQKTEINGIKSDCNTIKNQTQNYAQTAQNYYEQIVSITLPEAVLPTVASSDNGKFLRVVNGSWQAVTILDGSGVAF